MADISKELKAIEDAVYGEEVRGSIHNAIEKINTVVETNERNVNTANSTANTANSTANTANSTANTAKTTAEAANKTSGEAKTTAETANTNSQNALQIADIKFGVAITSETSSISGFLKGEMYLNTSTNELWKCTGSRWSLMGRLKGDQGIQGVQGIQGEKGDRGVSVTGVALTSEVGIVKTYTMSFSDGSAYSFQIKDGEAGAGTGDMLKSDYDKNGDGVIDVAGTIVSGTKLAQSDVLVELTEDEDGNLNYKNQKIKGGGSMFTQAEWEALPQSEKDKYDGEEIIITDDYESNICSGVQQCIDSKNPNDVAGASALVDLRNELNNNLSNLENSTRRTRKNITSNLANLSKAVAEQNLEKYGYTIGDYFVGASGYYYHLGDPDTYYGGYNNNAVVSTHHIGILVDTKQSVAWQESGTTVTSFANSTLLNYLSTTVLNNIKSDFKTLFGGSTGLEHLIANNILNNAIGGWGDPTWITSQYIRALTEVQVYGSRVFGADGYQTGGECKKLQIFDKFRFNEIFGNVLFWLKSLFSASVACGANSGGHAGIYGVTETCRAVALILFH